MASKGKEVDLGFVDETDSWRLLSHFFPSKVGGWPAWLALNPLPNAKDVVCGKCGEPCVFLLQVYAPADDDPACFHRTVYVFVCPKPACSEANSQQNLVVLRCQLSRENEFYSSDPPDEERFEAGAVTYPRAEDFQQLCRVCGCRGPYRCGRCHRASYCSAPHQKIDYKAGHKAACQSDPETEDFSGRHKKFLMPEFELTIAPEEYTEKHFGEKSEQKKMKEYEEYLAEASSTKPSDLVVADEKDLEKMARAESMEDKVFKKFQKRIKHEPEQVLRYDKGGQPLWVSADCVPTLDDIPACSCGAERLFEFQVMPQLLVYLKLDQVGQSIDWGTLAVYTCSANCTSEQIYKREFVWKQDFSKTDTV